MFYILLIFVLLMTYISTTEGSKRSFAALVFQSRNNFYALSNSDKNVSCNWLSRLKHQSKLCWRRRGLPEALLLARSLALKKCEEQFRYEQWNCSNPESFFGNIYRETAFMYSLASSAVMFSIARACSEGTLAGCKCGDHGKFENSSDWQWGGCGDNVKYARRFTKKFLQLGKKKNLDFRSSILKYNSEVGLRMITKNEEKFCRCHGVSGSCTVQVCWKRIKSFDIISKNLRNLYHNAVQVESKNYIHDLQNDKGKIKNKFLYLESSPNFCPRTVNRWCENEANCATLCCGRGIYMDTIQIVEQCNCSWRDQRAFSVHCDECIRNETILRCR